MIPSVGSIFAPRRQGSGITSDWGYRWLRRAFVEQVWGTPDSKLYGHHRAGSYPEVLLRVLLNAFPYGTHRGVLDNQWLYTAKDWKTMPLDGED